MLDRVKMGNILTKIHSEELPNCLIAFQLI
jgi:hypothetical protein